MNEPDLTHDGETTVFRDVLMLSLLGFMMIVVLLLPHINPPEAGDPTRPPGNVVVEVRWPDGLHSDVDLWVRGPGDAPVGYSRKSGTVFDLLRDDLGLNRDLTDLNYEFAFSRGAPAGEYAVNLHLYGLRDETLPIPVDVVVSLRNGQGGSMTEIASRRVDLAHEGEEVTVIRFRLDDRGALVPGSVNAVPVRLRSAG